MYKKRQKGNRYEGSEYMPMKNNRKNLSCITIVYAKLLFIENAE